MSSIKVYKNGRLQKQGCNIEGIIIIIPQDAFALSSCNGTKLPLISGSLRTDIRTGLLHNIMMPSTLHPCFLFYLHLTESLISCSSNLLAAHSIEFLQEYCIFKHPYFITNCHSKCSTTAAFTDQDTKYRNFKG